MISDGSSYLGSAGQAIISNTHAWLVTDSRFWVQAEEELDLSLWEIGKVRGGGLPGDWVEWLLNVELGKGKKKGRVGIDPEVVSVEDAIRLAAGMKKGQVEVLYPTENLVDKVWEAEGGRPLQSENPVFIHSIEFAGETAESKLSRLRTWMDGVEDDEAQVLGVVVTSLPEIAYLLNLRGADIEFNPLFHAYLYVGHDATLLFLDTAKVPAEVDAYLRDAGIQRQEYADIWIFLTEKKWSETRVNGKVIISPQTSLAIARALTYSGSSMYIILPSEVERMKAVKNSTEIEGLRKAYLRDGICFVRFLAWLESQVTSGQQITEWDAAQKLNSIRTEATYYQGLASENISASGPSAALPHYVPKKEAARVVDTQTPYLK
ncbi:hypothetical protein VNI00_005173 [Paramarasmius palmivorus]|uniref:Peptidase M24 domain-containing protein n=1 Tax=Paramarasmius palmivorus TaxID=297713 RepID=A0AAW0DK95_9AGAR